MVNLSEIQEKCPPNFYANKTKFWLKIPTCSSVELFLRTPDVRQEISNVFKDSISLTFAVHLLEKTGTNQICFEEVKYCLWKLVPTENSRPRDTKQCVGTFELLLIADKSHNNESFILEDIVSVKSFDLSNDFDIDVCGKRTIGAYVQISDADSLSDKPIDRGALVYFTLAVISVICENLDYFIPNGTLENDDQNLYKFSLPSKYKNTNEDIARFKSRITRRLNDLGTEMESSTSASCDNVIEQYKHELSMVGMLPVSILNLCQNLKNANAAEIDSKNMQIIASRNYTDKGKYFLQYF